MTGIRRYLTPAALGLTVMLTGCTSPNPVLYTIAPISGTVSGAVSGTSQNNAPAVVVLQPIGLARYLERSQIVLSSENYRLDVSQNDWWGEPLGAMLSRVLVEELGQRLPNSTVLNENGAVSSSADATVALNIQRLDLDAAGDLILMAQASVSPKAQGVPVLQSFRFSIRPSAPGVQAEVAAISAALGQLADKLAVLILTGSAAR